MIYTKIDETKKIGDDDMFRLYLFDLMETGKKDYIKDFHTKQTLIDRYYDFLNSIVNNEHLFSRWFKCKSEDVAFISTWVQKNSKYMDENEQDILPYLSLNYFTLFECLKKDFIKKRQSNPAFASKPLIWDRDMRRTDEVIRLVEMGNIMENFVIQEFLKNGVDIGFFYDIKDQTKGESKLGFEIKYDKISETSGNYYIELFHKGLKKTGLTKEDNTKWFILGTPNKYYIIGKITLKMIFEETLPKIVETTKYGLHNIGFLVKEEDLIKYGAINSIDEFCKIHWRELKEAQYE